MVEDLWSKMCKNQNLTSFACRTVQLTDTLLKPEISGTRGFSALKISSKSFELALLYLKVTADREKIEE